MARFVSYANAFTAGEVAEEAWDRSDLQQHAKGCAEGSNLLGLVTGPLASRGGFWDRGDARLETSRTRMVPFHRGDAVLVLEFGASAARVWTRDGQLVMDGASPYQFWHPWNAAAIARLWFHQIGDVLYVTNLDGTRTYVIQRFADDDWLTTPFGFTEGPWLPENSDTSVTLTFSDDTGSSITVTASAPVFSADMEDNTLLRIREGDGAPGFDTWTSGTEYTSLQKVQFDGRVYLYAGNNGNAKSGTTPPLHQSGTMSDGKFNWTYLHDGAGIIQVRDYTSPTSVTARVLRRLPTLGPTRYWSLQAYSNPEGYPRALSTDREERLAFAGGPNRPGVVDLTRTAGFGPTSGDFKPGMGTGRVVDDDAVRLDVGGGSRAVWMASATHLVVGCTDSEHIVSGSTIDDPITPASRNARKVSRYGSADVAPIEIQGPPPVIVHVLRSRRVMRELRVLSDLQIESHERSVLAGHIFRRGVAEMAWQQPDNIIWLRLDDGGLAAFTYHLEHQVFGAFRQPLPGGFTVESLCTVPGGDGRDRLFLSVHRVKGGVDQRRIWMLAHRDEAMFLDAAEEYAGAPATTISGLDHLEGETVAIVADGARVPDQAVSGGSVTLPFAASFVQVGLKIARRFESLPLDMEGIGSTNGRTLLPTHATVILSAADALVGTDAPDSAERVQSRTPDDLAGPVSRRLRQRVGLGGGADRDRRLVIESDAPFDLMIHAYRLEAEGTP